MRYQVVHIYPDGFVYAEAFREIIEMLQASFAALGHHVDVVRNQIATTGDVTPVIFGAHLLAPQQATALPAHAILYNAEHLLAGENRVPQHYYEMLARHPVWDFSADNVTLIRERLGNPAAHHLPVAYSPVFSRIPPAVEEIDVLFYGVLSERRKHVIEALGRAGLRVHVLTSVYGAERDLEIARAKVVLNLHHNAQGYLETGRVVFLLANAKAVVCERPVEPLAPIWDGALRLAGYDELVTACIELVQNETERARLSAAGYDLITRQLPHARDHLARLVLSLPEGSDTRGPVRALVAGSGRRPCAWAINADIEARRNPDWVVDFGRPIDWGCRIETNAAPVNLMKESFDAIIAHHLLEHINDLPTAMRNLLDLLRSGGALHIEVPYDLSHGAWQDPTHVRAFNERSWLYFTDWHDYLDWHDARFDLANLSFLLSPLGKSLRAAGHPDELLLRTPRAVDVMRLILIKRKLGPNVSA